VRGALPRRFGAGFDQGADLVEEVEHQILFERRERVLFGAQEQGGKEADLERAQLQ
jgi:hypothetical protein